MTARQDVADGAAGAALSYEEARALARSDDPETRRKLASRPDVVPEILYYLAEDPAPEVRREIAANHAAPVQANLMLAADSDAGVRSGLAEKIARLAPQLTAEQQERLRRMTHEMLRMLARDEVTRVRALVSEALKDVANAPPEVIRRLARDAELAVAGPVLEFSPVLSDEDLLDIIAESPADGALAAISRRAEVAAPVADAIAASDDDGAIAVLLANPSAQIREETLDRLIDRAPAVEAWHAPLVRRPRLSAAAASRLAAFVAENLVQALQDRRDLDAATAAAVATAVRKRLAEPRHRARPMPAREAEAVDDPLAVARGMHQSGRLDSRVIANALGSNDRDFVMAALAVRSELSLELVRHIAAAQNPKGLVALAWKAELPATMLVQMQTRLGRIPPTEAVLPQRGGTYPLSAEEMAWQLKFMASMVTGTAS